MRPCLARGWSPEQIAGRWQVQGRRWISHEAIYQYLYRDRLAGGLRSAILGRGRQLGHGKATRSRAAPGPVW